MTLHFAACLVITIPDGPKIFKQFLSLMQAVREENEALKQEIEAVKRKTAEQVSCLKSFKGSAVFSPPYSVCICLKLSFPLITGIIRFNSGRTPEQVRSIKLTLVFRDHGGVVVLCSPTPAHNTQRHTDG